MKWAIIGLAIAIGSSSAGYAPVTAPCPPAAPPTIRDAAALSSAEQAWITARHIEASAATLAWLKSLGLPTAEVERYASSKQTPKLAISISGGGYRSLLLGAGGISALDAREAPVAAAAAATPTPAAVSGFLQGADYIAGLSGGGWLVSSIVGNAYAKISDLSATLWERTFEQSLAVNSANPAFQTTVAAGISEKRLAGFPVSFNDVWGRSLSYQLLKAPDGGADQTFASIRSIPAFANHQMPLPILAALGVKPTECYPGPNATQYEFTPFEMGSWDAGVSAFVDIKFLGTAFSNSAVVSTTKCVGGFDNFGFVLGTSSDLYCAFDNCNGRTRPDPLLPFASLVAPLFSVEPSLVGSTLDAVYPNPFYNRLGSPRVTDQVELHLVDGGLALQNNPLWPLIQPARGIDIIVCNDNSADIPSGPRANFPNGSEIQTTYIQALSAGLKFPYIPPVDEFLTKGLTLKPTWFGCNNSAVPTVIYVANAQHGLFPANQPTSKLQYSAQETRDMIRNGLGTMSQDQSGDWARCLGCAVVYGGKRPGPRARASAVCTGCFDQYCYN